MDGMPPQQRRRDALIVNQVAIIPPNRAMASVKIVLDPPRLQYRDILGQDRIQPALDRREIVARLRTHTGHLPAGMHSRVRSASQIDAPLLPCQLLPGALQLSLNRPAVVLPLRTDEIGAI